MANTSKTTNLTRICTKCRNQFKHRAYGNSLGFPETFLSGRRQIQSTARASVAGESEVPNKVPEIQKNIRRKVEESEYFLKCSRNYQLSFVSVTKYYVFWQFPLLLSRVWTGLSHWATFLRARDVLHRDERGNRDFFLFCSEGRNEHRQFSENIGRGWGCLNYSKIYSVPRSHWSFLLSNSIVKR